MKSCSKSKNRERLAREEGALEFVDALVREVRRLESLSEDHFSVDGTLIGDRPRHCRF